MLILDIKHLLNIYTSKVYLEHICHQNTQKKWAEGRRELQLLWQLSHYAFCQLDMLMACTFCVHLPAHVYTNPAWWFYAQPLLFVQSKLWSRWYLSVTASSHYEFCTRQRSDSELQSFVHHPEQWILVETNYLEGSKYCRDGAELLVRGEDLNSSLVAPYCIFLLFYWFRQISPDTIVSTNQISPSTIHTKGAFGAC